jgi:hypothetical protein
VDPSQPIDSKDNAVTMSHGFMSGSVVAFLATSSLIPFSLFSPVDGMVQCISALQFAGRGGSGWSITPAGKGRMAGKESHQRSCDSGELYVSVVSNFVLLSLPYRIAIETRGTAQWAVEVTRTSGDLFASLTSFAGVATEDTARPGALAALQRLCRAGR